MSRENPRGETSEFEEVEAVEPSVEYNLKFDEPLKLCVKGNFRERLECRLGSGPDTSLCHIVHGDQHPDLQAKYVVLQPDVFASDPARGRVPVGGEYPDRVNLGRLESPELRLGQEVSCDHCSIEVAAGLLMIDDYSIIGTRVKLSPGDFSYLWVE
jgi:hypothetical protein